VKTPRCFFVCLIFVLGASSTAVSRSGERPRPQNPVQIGTVLRIIDGDTFKVALRNGPPRSVRLHAADAPERNQPWGRESKKALESLLSGKTVEIDAVKDDRYDRVVARVYVDGNDVDEWLISNGHAWVARQYAERAHDRHLCRLEHDARRGRRGLWNLPSSSRAAPWEWRQRGRREFTDYSEETAANCQRNFRRSTDTMVPPRGGAAAIPAALSAAPAPASAEARRPGCDIKGNISGNGRIYHLPGGSHYARTRIDEAKGERWFCSEAEARAAGWRPAR